MVAKRYNPLEHSVVQGLIRNEPHQSYEASDFHEALLFAVAREIGRVHWNRYQKSWDRWSDDPHIPGIQWRRYIYDCDCKEDEGFIPKHDENCPLLQPNFRFGEAEFNWYKNPGRGMSVNQDWAPEKWMEWFNKCLEKIREFGPKHSSVTQNPLLPMPKAMHFYLAECDIHHPAHWKRKDSRAEMISRIQPIESEILKGESDLKGEGWETILPRGSKAKLAALRLIAIGICAEKRRSEHEDRPRAK